MAGQPGGMTYRNLFKPPLGARARYYLGFRLPIEYRGWVESDIASDKWANRGAVIAFSVVLAILVVATAISGEPWLTRFLAAPVVAALFYRFNVMSVADWMGQRVLWRHHRHWGEKKRFELPGWVLIALMTLALGVAVWAVARDEIIDLIT